ncbi:hypothetical protein AAV32_09235 [Kerstersia gyiorum]|uniref:Uncharacterized protein n=1 Tax=Kerstersia gyiorum TaxID=206506 RepID=A0A171KS95_9BURK|nr:hypothetical protein AAV32_09235 [Kerstersia gyiorum]
MRVVFSQNRCIGRGSGCHARKGDTRQPAWTPSAANKPSSCASPAPPALPGEPQPDHPAAYAAGAAHGTNASQAVRAVMLLLVAVCASAFALVTIGRRA